MAQPYTDKLAFNNEFPKKNIPENWQYYNEVIRPNVQMGDLLFGMGNSLKSKPIQWKTNSIISHVGIIIRLESLDRVFVLESISKVGVRLIPLSKVLYEYNASKAYEGRVFIARHDAVNPLNADIIIKHGMDLLTNRYDNFEFIRIFLRTIFGKNRLIKNQQYTCSELVHECFLKGGIALKFDRGLFISPAAIWNNNAIEMIYQMI